MEKYNIKDIVKPELIIAGSFPSWYYALRKGWISEIPEGIDIDVYIIAPSREEAKKIFLKYHQESIYQEDLVNLHYPQESPLYNTYAPTPYMLISQFDVSVARIFIDDSLEIGYIKGENPLDDMKHKRLRLVNITNPIKEAFRIQKYIKRGFIITQSEITKLFLAWDSFPEEKKIEVLKQMPIEKKLL